MVFINAGINNCDGLAFPRVSGIPSRRGSNHVITSIEQWRLCDVFIDRKYLRHQPHLLKCLGIDLGYKVRDILKLVFDTSALIKQFLVKTVSLAGYVRSLGTNLLLILHLTFSFIISIESNNDTDKTAVVRLLNQ